MQRKYQDDFDDSNPTAVWISYIRKEDGNGLQFMFKP